MWEILQVRQALNWDDVLRGAARHEEDVDGGGLEEALSEVVGAKAVGEVVKGPPSAHQKRGNIHGQMSKLTIFSGLWWSTL